LLLHSYKKDDDNYWKKLSGDDPLISPPEGGKKQTLTEVPIKFRPFIGRGKAD